ncbi:MAG TPA: aminotransferase class V-fold PLP-dependent enzyme [Blastocatellia bacterium]|nr:aminotransferase class V-fold PLP-dependent enzyme [Blastocatellia bacterium]
MINEIGDLEKIARQLDPDAASRQHLLHQTAEYARRYLESIAHSPAYVSHSDNGRALLDSPISEEGISIDKALALLEENVDTLGINLTSGRYLGYIPAGGLFHSALGDYLAAITNRYAGLFFGSPGAVRIENMVIRWMASEIGYPSDSAGNLTSGGSLANLTAIVTAREDYGIDGENARKAVVYFTEQTHHCIDKGLHIAGLNHCLKRRVRIDANYRMDAEALEQAIVADQKAGLKPWLVVASAGTTNTGAVDPLSHIGHIASTYGLWFHVDGAYGGLFVLCPEGKAVLHGIHLSDSVVLDPHKSLFLPYGTGTVLVRDQQKLYSAFNAEADYIENILGEVDELSPADLSLELTKHFRGLRIWLPLKLLGVAPFRAALAEKMRLARYFYEQIKSTPGFEVGPHPDLSIVVYRYLPKRAKPAGKNDADEFNHRLMQAIQKEGRIFISSTRIDGKLVLRAAILSYRTHLDEVTEAVDIIRRKAKQLEQEL